MQSCAPKKNHIRKQKRKRYLWANKEVEEQKDWQDWWNCRVTPTSHMRWHSRAPNHNPPPLCKSGTVLRYTCFLFQKFWWAKAQHRWKRKYLKKCCMDRHGNVVHDVLGPQRGNLLTLLLLHRHHEVHILKCQGQIAKYIQVPLRMSCNNCGDPLCTFTLCSVLISRCYLHCGDHEAVDGKWTGPLLSDSTSVGFARPFLTAAELDGFVQVRVWYLGYLHRKNICVRTVTAAKKSVGSEIFIKQRFISPP